jgi:hypothetical protein
MPPKDTEEFAMLKSKFKSVAKTTISGALIALSLTQSGCTNRELVAGIAGAAIGATVVGIANSPPPPHHHHRHGSPYPIYPAPVPPPVTCRNERRQVCRTFVDYWGHPQTSCTDQWYNSCSGYQPMALGNATEAPTAVEVAKLYNMSFQSAQNFLDQLSKASQGDANGLSALGLNDEDIEALGSFKPLEPEALARVSKTLNIPMESTEKMIEQMLSFAKQKVQEQKQQEETSI